MEPKEITDYRDAGCEFFRNSVPAFMVVHQGTNGRVCDTGCARFSSGKCAAYQSMTRKVVQAMRDLALTALASAPAQSWADGNKGSFVKSAELATAPVGWPENRCPQCGTVHPLLAAPQAQPGMVMVPREPTPEMINAFYQSSLDAQTFKGRGTDIVERAYRAMLAALPAQGERS